MYLKIELLENVTISETAWTELLKTALNVAAPFIGVAFRAKTKNPQVAQATPSISQSLSGGKFIINGYDFRRRS